MLVVLGIILLLGVMSLPVIMSSRKSARLTVCIYQMRELGAAIAQYQSYNVQALPLAVSVDKPWPDPYLREAESGPPQIRKLLAPYLKTEKNMWKCPMQGDPKGVVEPSPFFSPAYQGGTDLESPLPWVPGYRYMSTVEMVGWVDAKGGVPKEIADKYRLKDWLVRSVAGLKPAALRSISPVEGGRIVTMIERSTVYHSVKGADIADLNPGKGERGEFVLNALFLDGHVDTLRIATVDELLKKIHAPLRQKFRGKELEETYPEAYVYPLPERPVR